MIPWHDMNTPSKLFVGALCISVGLGVSQFVLLLAVIIWSEVRENRKVRLYHSQKQVPPKVEPQ